MALLGIKFNSVSQFVEQVGRRQIWKYGELDQMMCIWNGPSYGAMKFRPKVNDKHPDFPLMFCTDTEITYQAAFIAEISATYAGSLTGTGGKYYVSPGILSTSPTQGSRDFVQAWVYQTGFADPDENGMQAPLLTCGTQTTTIRYVGEQAQVRYITNRPGTNATYYSHLGLGRVTWQILSETVGPYITTLKDVDQVTALNFTRSIPTIPPLFAAWMGNQIQQQGQFYNVTETYGPTF